MIVPSAAGVSRSTIGRLLNIYREAGLSGVREFNEQAPTSPLTEHTGSLSEECRICKTTYLNSHSVCELLKQIAQAGLQRPVTLVLDSARYQPSRLVEELAAELRSELRFHRFDQVVLLADTIAR